MLCWVCCVIMLALAFLPGVYGILLLCCSVFEHTLRVLDEFELYQDQRPIPRREINALVELLRDVIARSCGCVHARVCGHLKGDTCVTLCSLQLSMFGDSGRTAAVSAPEGELWGVFKDGAVKLLTALHDKHTARPITDDRAWLVDDDALHVWSPILIHVCCCV